jgi:Haem-binding uptake, Tiki superfamily, ChaN
MSAVAQQSVGPLEPIGVVVAALRKSPIVALGEVHGNEQCHQFRLALLRDIRVTDLVNDIVVEFGNAKYQDVVDSFVAGGKVGDAELRHVWQDTTQISGVWDRPMYRDFFRAVRDLNLSLPQNRRLRVLLGDPPVDWEVKRELVFDAKFPAPLNESRLYGGDDILGTVALHMTTVSR